MEYYVSSTIFSTQLLFQYYSMEMKKKLAKMEGKVVTTNYQLIVFDQM